MTYYGPNYNSPFGEEAQRRERMNFGEQIPDYSTRLEDTMPLNDPRMRGGGGIDLVRRGPGLSLGPGLMPSRVSQFIGKAGLGKAGMFGVPYLGAGLMLAKSLGLFGKRRSGPNQQQIDMNNLSNQMLGQSQAMSGYLGSMGRDLTDSGRQAMLLGRSRALDALTNPSVRMAQEANLASQLGNARAGVGPYVGILGGAGAGARYARSLNQFDPSLAQGMVGIGQNAIANRAQAGNMLAGFGGQDFGQGLGMQQTAYQIGQGGMGQRMGYLQGQQGLAAQQKAQRQDMLRQVAGLAARGATGGLIG